MAEHQYAGFWIRVAAALIDTLLLLIIIVPLLMAVYGGQRPIVPLITGACGYKSIRVFCVTNFSRRGQ